MYHPNTDQSATFSSQFTERSASSYGIAVRFATSAGANLGYIGPNFVREGHANLGVQIFSTGLSL